MVVQFKRDVIMFHYSSDGLQLFGLQSAHLVKGLLKCKNTADSALYNIILICNYRLNIFLLYISFTKMDQQDHVCIMKLVHTTLPKIIIIIFMFHGSSIRHCNTFFTYMQAHHSAEPKFLSYSAGRACFGKKNS